jgi:hypothetical protein
MDADYALLELEEKTSSDLLLNAGNRHELIQLLSTAASIPEGYFELIWRYGKKILDALTEPEINYYETFIKYGLIPLSEGLRASLVDKRILDSLSCIDQNYIPSTVPFTMVLKNTIIRESIDKALSVQPLPFINPSELGKVSETIQKAFVDLLCLLHEINASTELQLQWSASAIRILPQNNSYILASNIFLKALLLDARVNTAYFAFRALAEKNEGLWSGDTSITVLSQYIKENYVGQRENKQALLQLVLDEEVQRHIKNNLDLQILVGSLGIYLKYDCAFNQADAAVWGYILDLQPSYPSLSHAIFDYASTGQLPALPIKRTSLLRNLEQDFNISIEHAANEIHPRTYRGIPLAVSIYNLNVKKHFQPILAKIKKNKGSDPKKILNYLEELDPVALIVNNELQANDRYPIQGNLLQQMIRDNQKIIDCLQNAIQLSALLNSQRNKMEQAAEDETAIYIEFQLLVEQISPVGKWAFQTLLTPLWEILIEGLQIITDEAVYAK